MIPLLLGIGGLVVARIIQLHERRTQGQKLRTRDQRHKDRMNDLRAALREQWLIEEAKYQGQIQVLREQVTDLTNQVFRLATDTMEKDAGGIVKEVADLIVRVTQGDPGPVTTYENLADVLAGESGAMDNDRLFVPEHEQDILAWANDAMPTRGGWVETQEKEIGGRLDE